jgi:hypothetical protein
MFWLVLAVGMLLLLKEKMIIHNAEDDSIQYSIWKLMTLPYTLDMKPSPKTRRRRPSLLPRSSKDPAPQTQPNSPSESKEVPKIDTIQAATCSVDVIEIDGKDLKRTPISRTETYVSYGEHCITVQITMPSNFGIRSWRTLETFIEVMAVGLYLYATFVLMSLIFFTAQRAIVFAIQMAICLSFVRLFGLLF